MDGMNLYQRLALSVVTAFVAGTLKRLPADYIQAFLVRFGQAFGPVGLVHFSELSSRDQLNLLSRVPVLRGKHLDWPSPFRWIPRTWTCWTGPAPSIDSILMGNIVELKPIPNHGEWVVLDGYMAETTIEGLHYRLGWRWDDVDSYYVLSFTVKKF